MTVRAIAKLLAEAFLAGELEPEGMRARAAEVFNASSPVIARLVSRLLLSVPAGTRPSINRLARTLAADEHFGRFVRRNSATKLVRSEIFVRERKMTPASGAPATWQVPSFESVGELASILNLTVGELRWFADARGLERKLPDGPLRHYRYRWIAKRNGSPRLIEAPKPRLKQIQRFILNHILARLPVEGAVHGYSRGKSTRTYVQPHIRREAVLRMDLKDFFPSLRRPRVLAIFLTAGYPESVARMLTGLCVNAAPASVIAAVPQFAPSSSVHRLRRLYGEPHLPQGAPTSPAVANLCAFRLDRRLQGLANSMDAAYTRYADDLLFSGGINLLRAAERFHISVCRIALEEGFEVQTRKTRLMRRGVAQRAGGLVLNEKPNLPRAEYDRLKAVLHNSLRHGPETQNRAGILNFKEHLAGRIAYFKSIHPQRGEKLESVFSKIAWPGNQR